MLPCPACDAVVQFGECLRDELSKTGSFCVGGLEGVIGYCFRVYVRHVLGRSVQCLLTPGNDFKSKR